MNHADRGAEGTGEAGAIAADYVVEGQAVAGVAVVERDPAGHDEQRSGDHA